MRLQLTRPLIGLDFEATGTDAQTAQICQYAFLKVMPDGSRKHLTGLIKPTIPMPADAQAVHGITDEMLKDAPSFPDMALEILLFIQDTDLAGFNLLMYDVPLLCCEFDRAGVEWDHLQHNVIDAGNIFKIQEPRTLSAATLLYTGVRLVDAHDALGDVVATLEVLSGQLERYPDLPANVAELAKVSNYGKGRADAGGKFMVNHDWDYVINFGKYKGQLAKNCIDYLYWILGANFPADVRKICEQIIDEHSERISGLPAATGDTLPF